MPSSSLSPELFQILLVLSKEELHGYAILKEIERSTNGSMRLEPSPLYRRLKRLVDEGIVAEVDRVDPEDERRKFYRLTPAGRRLLQVEARRLVELASEDTVRALAARARS